MRRVLFVIFGVLGVLILCLVVAVLGVYFNAQRVINARTDRPAPNLQIQSTPERVARGRFLISTWSACIDCHASNRENPAFLLDGGKLEAGPLGTFFAPNLTSGGPLKDFSDGEVVRAIREGIGRDGRTLLIMPSSIYRNLSDEDVQSIVAYLRSQPASNNPTPAHQIGPLGYALIGTGQLPVAPQPPVSNVQAPSRGPTAAYGEYLTNIAGCRDCHGPKLDGTGQPPGPPPGPSLAVMKEWTEAQFLQTIRTGKTPSGDALNPEEMPWQQFARAPDDDLRALYLYLKQFFGG
ncbi:MAG: c-type cytochrome [Dehalococcoidia bacterium]